MPIVSSGMGLLEPARDRLRNGGRLARRRERESAPGKPPEDVGVPGVAPDVRENGDGEERRPGGGEARREPSFFGAEGRPGAAQEPGPDERREGDPEEEPGHAEVGAELEVDALARAALDAEAKRRLAGVARPVAPEVPAEAVGAALELREMRLRRRV